MAEAIEHPALAALPGVRHGFFTRNGGVSEGLYRSLNCGLGSKDSPEAVRENRARAAAQLDVAGDRLCTAYQIHSAEAIVVEEPWQRAEAPRVDALVSRTPGIALGILTADCAPVLLADAEARVIGAVHAGWRGALNGVLEAALDAMIALGTKPAAVVAVVGPTIQQASYEVGPEFPAPFLAREPGDADLFVPSVRDGHFQFDLPAYVTRRLRVLGLGAVDSTGHDTCAEEQNFFSYRRNVRQGESDYGRGLSAITLAR